MGVFGPILCLFKRVIEKFNFSKLNKLERVSKYLFEDIFNWRTTKCFLFLGH